MRTGDARSPNLYLHNFHLKDSPIPGTMGFRFGYGVSSLELLVVTIIAKDMPRGCQTPRVIFKIQGAIIKLPGLKLRLQSALLHLC